MSAKLGEMKLWRRATVRLLWLYRVSKNGLLPTAEGSACPPLLVCTGSACAGGACAGSVCTGSVCAGSVCTGGVCTGSVCAGSVCTAGGAAPRAQQPAQAAHMQAVGPWRFMHVQDLGPVRGHAHTADTSLSTTAPVSQRRLRDEYSGTINKTWELETPTPSHVVTTEEGASPPTPGLPDGGCESCVGTARGCQYFSCSPGCLAEIFTWVAVASRGHCASGVSSFSLLFQKLLLPSAATHSPTQEMRSRERLHLPSSLPLTMSSD